MHRGELKEAWGMLTKKINVNMILPHFVKLCNLNLCLWGLISAMITGFSTDVTPQHCITGRNANKASLCIWKPDMPCPCSSERGAQPWIPRSSHPVISTEHRPLTMNFGLSLVFLVLILKGNLLTWDSHLLCTHEKQKICFVCFVWLLTVFQPVFSVCRCPVWGEAGGVWWRLSAAWKVPETLLCSLWIHFQ